MSECVVRMEMPGCCWDCPCLDDYGDYPRCRRSNEQREYNFPIHEKRMPGCPITQPLPEGHGRLVDADACARVLRKLENEAVKPTEKLCFGYAAKMFEEAFTIVPAERNETK